MHHRCNHPATKGGVSVPDHLRICGELICAPCSSAFGNDEGVFRCALHSNQSNVEDDDDKESVVPLPPRSRKGTRVSGKGTKSSEYTAKDLLILSQAFIHISEDAIE